MSLEYPMHKFTELQKVIGELRREINKKPDEAFTCWYLMRCGLQKNLAVAALTGRSNEQAMDAIYVDDSKRQILVVQTKFHEQLGASEESEDPISRFLDNVPFFDLPPEDLKILKKQLNPNAWQLFNDAYQKRRAQDYSLLFLFVTTKKVNGLKINKLRKKTEFKNDRDDFTVIQAASISALLENYLVNQASEPPLITLELGNKSYLHVKDRIAGINARVVSIPAEQIGQLYDRWNESLFNLNIRGYEGRSSTINKSIEKTLEEKPEDFFYLNNGVTIVCEDLIVSGDDPVILKLTKPQIINGQQTTRAISQSNNKGRGAEVLVKIIDVSDIDRSKEKLVRKIVKANNSQNRVQLPDLISNDSRQREIQILMLREGYYYQRKRNVVPLDSKGLKADAKFVIKMHEIWKPIVATKFGPGKIKKEKDIFDLESEVENNPYYEQIFDPNQSIAHFLVPHWLSRIVTDSAKRQEFAFAKWYVLKVFWDLGGKQFLKDGNYRALALVFNAVPDSTSNELRRDLQSTIEKIYTDVYRYYKENRKKNKRGQWPELSTYIRSVKYEEELYPYMKRTGLRALVENSMKGFEEYAKSQNPE